MTRGVLPALAALAALAVAATGSAATPTTSECAGLQTCIDVPGPWVAVPARGQASFLLDCPQRRGVVGGVDSLASSRDVHVTFDGLLGGPVAPGRTTTRYAFFRAFSGRHVRGLFEPRIGCIPSSGGQRSTTSARAVTPAGAPVVLAAATLPLTPGTERHTTIGCANGSRLVDSWDATAFAALTPPAPALAEAVRVQRTVRKGQVVVTFAASETLPRSAHALLQIGVVCAT
jgi:hypothetical protein